MFNLYKCALLDAYPTVCVESEAEASYRTQAPAWSLVFFSYSKNNLEYALSFGTVKGLLLCVCIHNINIVLL